MHPNGAIPIALNQQLIEILLQSVAVYHLVHLLSALLRPYQSHVGVHVSIAASMAGSTSAVTHRLNSRACSNFDESTSE